jgi:hypothetical protein
MRKLWRFNPWFGNVGRRVMGWLEDWLTDFFQRLAEWFERRQN